MITGGRTGGLSFGLFGVPITIHLTSVLFLALLGFGLEEPARIAIWVGVGIVAIVLHELGHALVGRRFGLHPRIDLAGLGGVTSWRGSDGALRSRGRSLAISAAGPGVGIVTGLAALAAGAPWRLPADAGLWTFSASVWVFVSLGWGVLNLLPILPLDGGRILQELLPGVPAERRRRAAVVGVGVAIGAAVWAAYAGLTFGAVFLAFFAWNNLQVARGPQEAATEPTAGLSEARDALSRGDHQRALGIARAAVRHRGGDPAWAEVVGAAARGLLDTQASFPDLRDAVGGDLVRLLDEGTVARLLARHDDREALVRFVAAEYERQPDARRRGIAALVHTRLGDPVGADRWLQTGPVSPQVQAAVRALREG